MGEVRHFGWVAAVWMDGSGAGFIWGLPDCEDFRVAGVRVLVGCEFSQIVTKAFRDKGHEAFSCDILPTEGNPDYHINGDVLGVLGDGWDLAIFHPPCTHLAVSGARWFKKKQQEQEEALEFVRRLMDSPIEKICIENPISIISSKIRKPDQIIQPWQFGHGETKATCLWLKGLPTLIPTNVVEDREGRVHREPPGPERWKNRSRTYQGFADALATQYTAFIKSGMTVSEWADLLKGLDILRRNAIIDKYVQL